MQTYDLLIIGGGAAGLTAALTAQGLGKKVAIIEKQKIGGECTWSGCIPSKALINLAEEIWIAKKYYRELLVDTSQIMKEIKHVIEKVYQEESPEVLAQKGIDVIAGEAEFLSATQIQVNEAIYEAPRLIIATGSNPLIPPIEGIETVNYLTNETFFQLEKLPESLIIVGGGSIGVELAQALNRVGVKVTLIEMAERLLSREEAEFSEKITARLSSEGVAIYTKTQVMKATHMAEATKLTLRRGEEITELTAAQVLLAVGRKANVAGLSLEKAGIEYQSRGLVVDDYLRTSNPRVYACGDVVGPYQLSHMANYQGITATLNAFLPWKRKVDYTHIIWCVFTDPEFARAGLTEKEAREQYGDRIKVYYYDFAELDRVKTQKDTAGLAKVILDRRGRILGAHLWGARAGEIISQLQALKSFQVPLARLQGVIHPYPTYGELLRKIGKKAYLDQLFNHPLIKLIRSFTKK